MIVDTHAHLTYKGLVEDVDGVVARARGEGVGAIITIGIDAADSVRAVEIAKRYDDVWAAVGVHPHDTEKVTQGELNELAKLAEDPKVVAWGETGLDYFRDHSPRDVQRKWFRIQAAMAREQGLPLVVHDREAHDEVLKVLEPETKKGLRGVMHCFSGDVEFAGKVLDLGFNISIPGTVTYPKNTMLKDVVRAVPLERCMLETDCPFLSPQKYRGKKNEPAYIIHTAREVAELKGLGVEDVARITTRAAAELFGVGEVERPRLAYAIRNSLYLNITDKCTNACVFCSKNRDPVVKGHDLSLGREPGAEELLAAVEGEGGPGAWEEVVFCGYGEPLLRLELVEKLAAELKRRGAKKIRVNTDGLADMVHGENVTARLKGLVDAISVSLNAADSETYEKLCRPPGEGAFGHVVEFLKRAKENIPEVTATAVTVPGLDVKAVEKLAASLGVEFRARQYNEVG